MKSEPHHFTLTDFGKALFGSFIVGLTFIFKGGMTDYASNLNKNNIIAIILLTMFLVSVEIYFLSYKFVKNRVERPFYEFWGKRFFAIIISSFMAIYLSLYLYGINTLIKQTDMLKVTCAVLLPAAIAGAAIEILKK
ncbi:MAG: hypothetical protein NT001_00465 [Candidatus Woesearchaeota archaeon]|nr:hypothetical protein [Candidatus Woesearchaeota archaeon]